MGLVEPTPYDLRWRMFGTHIRVHPFFWIMSAIIAWDLIDVSIACLLLGIVCIFVSILLHEFGHIWMGRFFGSEGHIVLWSFGGLAYASNHLYKRGQRILVSFAGPLIQLLLWAALWFTRDLYMDRLILMGPTAFVTWSFFVGINLYWALFNLLPLWPMDGGMITREICTGLSPHKGIRISLHISIGVAILLTVYSLLAEQLGHPIPYLPVSRRTAIFFGIFAVIGIQTLMAEDDRDRWVSDRVYREDDERW